MRTRIVRATVAVTLALAAAVPAASAQQTTGSVTGTVTDLETLAPVRAASVLIEGTTLGQITGAEGRYLLTGIPVGEVTVRAQQIGYGSSEQTVTVTAGQAVVVDFQLQPQAVQLDELVVTGYGAQRREDLTGAVAKVSAAEFIEAPARDAASLIAGKIAGLNVVTPSGDPRAGTQIRLRGFGSFEADREPLVIVDGVPGSLETVSPQDIESIDVLKDASAAAVYGSRAANGVIFITTKRYDGGQPTIRYEGFSSIQTLYREPDFLTAGDVRQKIAEGFVTPTGGNSFEDLGYSTDWQDAVLRDTPLSYTHSLTVLGGSGDMNYTASLNYEYDEGIFRHSDNKDITGRVNIGHRMFDGKLDADLNLVSRIQNQFEGPSFNAIWRQVNIRNPTDRIYTEDGEWQTRGGYVYFNPVQMLDTEEGQGEFRDLRLHGSLRLRPVDQLSVSVMGGTERGQWLNGSFTNTQNPFNPGINNGGRSSGSNVSQIFNVTGTYDEVFGGHQVNLVGGYEYYDVLNESFFANNERFPTDLFGFNDLGSGEGLPEGLANIGSGKSGYKTIGFFGRLNWDWNNRFLATASLRYEGDSRFGADHKWGLFPGISLGWRLTEEAFLADRSFIDDLKLRAGFGITGIAPNSPYLSLTTYEYGGNYPVGGRWVQGLEPSRNPNPELRWEQKEEVNVGLDFSMFDFRLAGTLDAYRRDTKDLLYEYDVPVPPYLFGDILANVGTMRNEGIEASLTYDVVRSADFRWRANANWSTNENRLVSLNSDVFETEQCFNTGYTGEPIQTSTHRVCVGGPIGDFYGFESVDINEDGEWIVLDSAGVNRLPYSDATQNDRRVLGNGIPDHFVALNNNFQWRNWDLAVNMRGAFGNQILNFQRMYYENPNNVQYNMLRSAFHDVYGKRMLDFPLVYVSYYVEDGDYWKIDNATLGYTFDARSLPLVGSALQDARVYLAGRNLLTITGYDGMDPEVSIYGGSPLDPGNDFRDQYPTTRTFTVGVSVVF